MPQVYFTLDAGDLEAVDLIAERDFDGNRSGVLREAVGEYLYGRKAGRAVRDHAAFAALARGTEPA